MTPKKKKKKTLQYPADSSRQKGQSVQYFSDPEVTMNTESKIPINNLAMDTFLGRETFTVEVLNLMSGQITVRISFLPYK